ncbi:hypothetical protein Vretimale_3134, partial [Volvox reticuliferus]
MASHATEMDADAQEYRRASLRQMNPGARKSVNWARRHPPESDADGFPVYGDSGSGDGEWRDGAISPLEEFDGIHYSAASSTAGGGYVSRYGSRNGGLSRSVSATTGVGSSRASEIWESGTVA